MAVAPLNKFLTLAVPVAPGEQTIYTAPVGTSAIVLYAQVSNVGIGQSYPTVTFSHRRTSVATRTAGNVRNNRIIKDGEVPPNDALVLVDGRLVLERTAIISDSIVITGTQSGVTTIMDVDYNNNSGITTVATLNNHNLSVGDQITMAGIAFTCTGTYGLTTSIFPEPQAAFTITEVPTSKTFVTNSGIVNNLTHDYTPAIHRFVRAETGAISVTGGASGPFTPTNAQYDSKTGIVTFSVVNHGLLAPTTHTAGAGTTYSPLAGIMTVTVTDAPNPPFQNGEYVKFNTGSLDFDCRYGGGIGTQSYPRIGDPVNGKFVQISNVTGNTFEVNVGTAKGDYTHIFQTGEEVATNAIITGGNYTHTWKGGNASDAVRRSSAVGVAYTVTAASYTANSGELVLTLSDTAAFSGTDSINIALNSLTFACQMDNYATDHTYPRPTDPINTTLGSPNNGDSGWSRTISCTKSGNQITLNVGASPTVQYTPSDATYNPTTGEMVLTLPAGYNINNDKSSVALAATTGTTYNPSNGQLDLQITGHGLHTGDRIKFVDESLSFSCTAGSFTHIYTGGTATDAVTVVSDSNTKKDVTAATYTPADGLIELNIGSHTYTTSDTIRIAANSLSFTCDEDSHGTTHTYPRVSDPAYETILPIVAESSNTITVNVGSAQTTDATGYPRSSDPDSNKWLPVTYVNANKVRVAITSASNTAPHTFVNSAAGSIKVASDSIKLSNGSIVFTCDKDNHASKHYYPRPSDPYYNNAISVGSTTTNSMTLFVGKSVVNQSHHFISGTNGGVKRARSTIGISSNSLIYKCSQDNYQTEHAYPRVSDPAYNQILGVDVVGVHTYVNGPSVDAVNITGVGNSTVTAADYNPTSGDLVLNIGVDHGVTSSNTATIAANSLAFTCDKDSHATTHTYPRTTDPSYNKALAIKATDAASGTITVNVGKVNTFSAFVGINTAGGLVAPLQMEFICSILENSSA